MPSSTLELINAAEPRYMAQVLATLAVSLGPFAAGLSKGYSSPALASLQSPLPVHNGFLRSFSITAQEGSWIASLSLLGALFGGPFGGFAMRYGRRRTLLGVAIPFSCSWLLTIFATCVSMMYITAFLCGFCSAIVLLASHVYISEIASPEIRGGLCAVAKMASHIGLLISFSLGAYLDWRRLAMVASAAPIMFFIAAFYIPETPSYLALKGRETEAYNSLQWLRGADANIDHELSTIQANVTRQKLPRFRNRFYVGRRFLGPTLVTCGLMMFQRLSGAHAFNFYAVPIFRASFVDMDPHGAAVVVGFVQLLAAVTSGLLVDTLGRLPLLIISNSFMSLALAGFGTFIHFNGPSSTHSSSATSLNATSAIGTIVGSADADSHPHLDWIPLVCVLVFTVAFSIGVGPIAWLLIGELYPLEYRGIGGAITTCFSYACAFISVKTFVDFESSLGLDGAFWLYAVISAVGLVFVLVCVPETRGKGLDEMEHKNCNQT